MNTKNKTIATGIMGGYFMLYGDLGTPDSMTGSRFDAEESVTFADWLDVTETIQTEIDVWQGVVDEYGDEASGRFLLIMRSEDFARVAYLECLPTGVTVRRFDGESDSFHPMTVVPQLVMSA